MTDTIWLKAYELLQNEEAWGKYTAVGYDRECYCAGSAIAKVLTGNPYDLYGEENHPTLYAALTQFADHVGARKEFFNHRLQEMVAYPAASRVYDWNDAEDRTHEEVLKALMELHQAEVASTTT